MSNHLSSLIMTLVIVIASFSLVVTSNVEDKISPLDEKQNVMNVILPLTDLNKPGFQEGSNFSNGTIAAGSEQTCGILDNGWVSCWGRGDNGALGNGDTEDRLTPTQTSSLGIGRTAVSISAGQHHTCAILDNGSVSCWGNIKHLQ